MTRKGLHPSSCLPLFNCLFLYHWSFRSFFSVSCFQLVGSLGERFVKRSFCTFLLWFLFLFLNNLMHSVKPQSCIVPCDFKKIYSTPTFFSNVSNVGMFCFVSVLIISCMISITCIDRKLQTVDDIFFCVYGCVSVYFAYVSECCMCLRILLLLFPIFAVTFFSSFYCYKIWKLQYNVNVWTCVCMCALSCTYMLLDWFFAIKIENILNSKSSS